MTKLTKGAQIALPGAGHDVAGVLARRAAAPLKPKVAQAACDAGLFSDDARQLDLVDAARAAASVDATPAPSLSTPKEELS